MGLTKTSLASGRRLWAWLTTRWKTQLFASVPELVK